MNCINLFLQSTISPIAANPILASENAIESKVTSHRTSIRNMQHQLAAPPALLQPKPIYVGELGERWQFPSDHLPIGVTIGNLHFANWNILNTKYLHHIESNTQGLKDSLIMVLNQPSLNDPRLTLREELVLQQTLYLLQHPDHPRSVLCLQETGENFWTVIKERLPEKFKTLTAFESDLANEDVFIFDSSLFLFENLDSKKYDSKPSNTMMSLTLRERSTDRLFRIIQSHVPGGPNSESPREELADFAIRNYDPSMVMILMGDMNRPPEDILKNFERAAAEKAIEQPFISALIPYPTHINTHREASWIDNLFYAIPHDMQVRISSETDFFPEVEEVVKLIFNPDMCLCTI